MKQIVFLLLLIPVLSTAQPLGTWPVSYGDTHPTHTPSSSGTRIYLNIATNDLYNWNPAPVSSWVKYPKGFDQISGCSAPGYTPTARQSVFAVNSCTVLQNGMGPELYYYTGSAWLQINERQTYEAGSGIDITDGVISSTATGGPDSTFAKTNNNYANKRIADNVYKNGTFGVGTTDTTGRINVATKNGASYKPMIFTKGVSNGADSVNLFLLSKSSDTTAAPFLFGVTNSGNISASGKNSSFFWGQNIYPGGAKIQAGKPALFQFWETNFINSMPVLGDVQTYEWHMAYVPSTSAGADQRRILTSAYDWQGRIANFGVKADQFTFYKFGSIFPGKPSVYASIDFFNNTFYFNDTMNIVLRKPNVGGYFATKSDNSAVNLISIDASNRVAIAPNNASTIYTGANTIESAGGLKITANSTANLTIGDNVKTGGVIFQSAASEVLRFQNPLSTTGWAFSMNGYELAIRDMSVGRNIFQVEENGITDAQYIHADGRVCFGGRADFDVQFHIKRASIGASSKMLRLENSTGGNNFFRSNSTPSAGSAGDVTLTSISGIGDLWVHDGTANRALAKTIKASATLDFSSTSTLSSSDLTIAVTGAVVGDGVQLGAPASIASGSCYTAWVSSANTVTVRLNNYSGSSIDPSSATFNVIVVKY